MQSKAATVKEYLDELPEDRRKALSKLRTLIRKAAPGAKEGMQYGMIGYTMGPMLCALASQKGYMALYVGGEALEAHRARLGKLNCGKSCIRFRALDELPLDAVTDILADTVRRCQAGQGACGE
jgi:uncharacterized protein YdhG (YjbR/CyaY superfamily)